MGTAGHGSARQRKDSWARIETTLNFTGNRPDGRGLEWHGTARRGQASQGLLGTSINCPNFQHQHMASLGTATYGMAQFNHGDDNGHYQDSHYRNGTSSRSL